MDHQQVTRTGTGSVWLFGARASTFFSSGRRLIASAALLHVVLAVGLFWAGRAQVAPGLVDRDGIMGSFASDSYKYQQRAERLVEILGADGIGGWAAAPELVHVKLLSIQFVLLGPFSGHGTLTAEPLNLLCYAAILSLVLVLGREVGGRRVGLTAAGIVALWPSFLLHTLQLLKDPLFIASALAFILVITTWLTRTYRWRDAVGMGALMAVAIGLLLLVRIRFGAIVFAIVLCGFALLMVRQWRERRWLYWNMACPALILVLGALAPFYLTAGTQKLKRHPSLPVGQAKFVIGPGKQLPTEISYRDAADRWVKAPLGQVDGLHSAASKAVLAIGGARYRFNSTSSTSGSSIDEDVEFRGLGDVLLYLPRAAAIGFWAPFPGSWIGAGMRVGSAGRLLSGAETLVMYLFEALALLAVLRAPRSLPAWLLLLIPAFGLTALGLVVSNVGSLYRFRYLFWMLLIILAAKGVESSAHVRSTR